MELFPAKKQNCPEAASQGTSGLNGPSRRKPRVAVGRSARPAGHWPCATERWPRSRKGPGAGLQALGGGGRQRPLTLTRGAAPNVEGWPGPLPPGSPPTPQARPQGRERHNSWPPPGIHGKACWEAGAAGRGGLGHGVASRGEAGTAPLPKGLKSWLALGLGTCWGQQPDIMTQQSWKGTLRSQMSTGVPLGRQRGRAPPGPGPTDAARLMLGGGRGSRGPGTQPRPPETWLEARSLTIYSQTPGSPG